MQAPSSDLRPKLFHLLLMVMIISLSACAPVAPSQSVSTTTASAALLPAAASTFTPAPTATHLPPPSLPAVTSPQLAHIYFQDANDGWAVSIDGTGHILRTLDGGATWLDATPPGTGSIGVSVSLSVLDVDHVWALVPGSDFYASSLFHTSDGGASWTSSQLPFGSALLQFVDPLAGRALADRGAGAGSQAVGLYQTSDAGLTWTSVFHNDPAEPGFSDSLPLGGIKNGLTFTTPSTGWVTASLPQPGNIYIYATRDGGVSWSQQSLPLPGGYTNVVFMAHAPLFFGQSGLLPLTVYLADSSGLSFFSTRDGGLTWTGDPARSVPAGRYSFADASHGWVWDGGNKIYNTNDGALSWTASAVNLDLSGKLSQLVFVPSRAGQYVGFALTGLDENNHAQLYRSVDNGVTWTPVLP